jgi:peptide/nickel transport system permease protein
MNEAKPYLAQNSTAEFSVRQTLHGFSRVAKYAAVRAVSLLLAVMVGLYLTILVINLGGYIDKIFESDVSDEITGFIQSGALRDVTDESRADQVWAMRWALEEEKGLHVPFMLRTWRWFIKSLTLDWKTKDAQGPLAALTPLNGGYLPIPSNLLSSFLLERLPYSLLLLGAAGFLLYITTIPLALSLSRQNSNFSNGMVVVLSSATSAPAWIHGIILIFIFCTLLGILPYPRFNLTYLDFTKTNDLLYFLRSAILPILSIFLGLLFQSLYTWRAFFSIYSQEDYVELGKAKGLTQNVLEREYILKPTMPYVVTSFAMLMLGLWQTLFALETLFKWPGLGAVMLVAIRFFNTPLLLGMVTLFAYLMAITVILLDFFYAWVDPRVRIDLSPQIGTVAHKKNFFPRLCSRATFSLIPSSRHSPSEEARIPTPPARINIFQHWRTTINFLRGLGSTLRQIYRQSSGAIGLSILLGMFGFSIYAAFAYPADQLAKDWRDVSSHGRWYANPKNAFPTWSNFFRRDKLPETVFLDSRKGQADKSVNVVSDGLITTTISFQFDYQYDEMPQELVIYLYDQARQKFALTHLTWITPNGQEIDLGTIRLLSGSQVFYLLQNEFIQSQDKKAIPIETLFPKGASRGVHQLLVKGYLFEEGSNLDAEVILHGQVYGLAGTDEARRDLTLPMIAGLPVALAFGVLGAIATTLLSMVIAALGAWYGGWVDNLIQRISDVNMTVPTLAVAILVFLMYSNSIWVVLGTLILLSVFGSSLKNYRAVFLQVKSSPYIEAAMSQGASDWRIIWKYLMPRIYPTIIPQIAVMVPVYVYYEVTLAFLGVSDPILPTWGRMIYEAIQNQAFQYHPYRILMPLALLLLTGLGFSLLSSALERVLNPRLREE